MAHPAMHILIAAEKQFATLLSNMPQFGWLESPLGRMLT